MKNENHRREEDRGSKAKLFVVSLAIHVILLVVFPFLLANFRKNEEPEEIKISFYRPEELREPPPPRVEPVPEVVPQVARREVQPVPEITPPPPRPPATQPKPARAVRTNRFAQAPAEPAEPKPTPRRKTRSAGFGEAEPRGTLERPPTNHRASARLGDFQVAPAPADAPPAPKQRTHVVASTGFGDETERPALAELETRDRVSVQSTGFTIEAIPEHPSAPTGKSASISTGGFGSTVAVNAAPRERKRPATNPDTPVEILVKPRPVYTSEARALHVEGEIVLRVVFVASGEMRVLSVVQGLGHGLDEAAVAAAEKIEFKPARRDGKPVDYVAVLRIVFQLA